MLRDFFGDLQIVIIYIEIVVLWQLSFYFLKNVWEKKGEKEIYGNVSIALTTFFFCYSIYKLYSMIWTYYSTDLTYRSIGRIFLIIGALIFILILNHIFFKQLFKQDSFRKIYVGLLFGSTIIFVSLYYYYSNLESLIMLLTPLIILVSILIFLSVKWFISMGGVVKTYMLVFIIGATMFIGGAASTRIIQYLPPDDILKAIADSIETGGVIIIAIGVWGLPVLSEINWKMKLIHLYTISSSGMPIFEYSFKKGEVINPALISGGITGVVAVVKEMTKSEERLSIIKQGDRNIILEYGENVTMALIIEEDLEIYHHKLKKLLNRFEGIFKEILLKWKGGDIEIFKPTEMLVEQIFQ